MIPRTEVDNVDATGSTALIWATRYQDSDSVQKLLLCGSNPSHRDLYGLTPLHIAAGTGDVSLLNLLLSAKPDVNSEDKVGYTALHVASKKLEGTRLAESLISHGANVEHQEDMGHRPLHASVWSNVPASVHLLLDKGANIHAANNRGINSLMFAVAYNSHDVLRLLLREESLEYDVKNIYGQSVLDYAALCGDVETIRILHSASQMKTIDLDSSWPLSHAKWRRDKNEASSLHRGQPPDEDPQLQYSAFKALWDSIAEAQQLDIEKDSGVESIEDEQICDDEGQTNGMEHIAEDDEQTDNDNEDDDDDDDADSELWADAPESQHGSTN